ncbi:MAG: sugar nucleotidyltransferase, partial [Kangiellaceae bacterium]
LIISTEKDLPAFQAILSDGAQFGVKFHYKVQSEPKGVADAFLLAEDFIGKDNCCLVLGDNVFYGQDFQAHLAKATSKEMGATIFCYHVKNPNRYGVAEFNERKKIIGIEEKPVNAKSNWAVTGLYFFDHRVVDMAKQLTPSKRGELEITDLINNYLNQKELDSQMLGRGFAWLDTGTHQSLLDAGQFVQTIENRQGLKVACLEEIAYSKGWISDEMLKAQISLFNQTSYGEYLERLIARDY